MARISRQLFLGLVGLLFLFGCGGSESPQVSDSQTPNAQTPTETVTLSISLRPEAVQQKANMAPTHPPDIQKIEIRFEQGERIVVRKTLVMGIDFYSDADAIITKLQVPIGEDYTVRVLGFFDSKDTWFEGVSAGEIIVPGRTGQIDVQLGPKGFQAPYAYTDHAENVKGVGVKLHGSLHTYGFPTAVLFEYGTERYYLSNKTPIILCAANNAICDLSAGKKTISEIIPITDHEIYYYRFVADSGGGTAKGKIRSFKLGVGGEVTMDTGLNIIMPVVSDVPTVMTQAATEILQNSATLNGMVNPKNSLTKTYFEYGETTSYGNTTALQSVGNRGSDVPVSTEITGLDPNKTYHFRMVAFNANGTTVGGDRCFRAYPPAAPTVVTRAPIYASQREVIFFGTVDPNHLETHYYFEISPTADYETTIIARSKPPEPIMECTNGVVSVSVHSHHASFFYPTPNHEYHYRLVAENAIGITRGQDQTFTVKAYDADALSVWQEGAQIVSSAYLRDNTGNHFQNAKALPGSRNSSGHDVGISHHRAVVAWEEIQPGGTKDIVAAWSEDGGVTFKASSNLSHSIGIDSIKPDVAILRDTVVIAWQEGSEIHVAHSRDGGETFASTSTNISNSPMVDSVNPKIAIDGYLSPNHIDLRKDFMMVGWEEGSGDGKRIYAAHSNDGGENFSVPVNVSSDAIHAASEFDITFTNGAGPNIALVAWQEASENHQNHKIKVARYLIGKDLSLGSPKTVSDSLWGNAVRPKVLLSFVGVGAVVVWQQGNAIFKNYSTNAHTPVPAGEETYGMPEKISGTTYVPENAHYDLAVWHRRVLVAWAGTRTPAKTSPTHIFSTYSDNTGESFNEEPQPITSDSAGISYARPEVAFLDRESKALVIFQGHSHGSTRDIFFARFNNNDKGVLSKIDGIINISNTAVDSINPKVIGRFERLSIH